MQRIYFVLRHALPIVFLAYAAVANWEIFTGDAPFGQVEGDLMTGGAASSVDTLYSKALPHRATAVGMVGAGRYLLLGEGRAGVEVGRDNWLFTDEEMRPATKAQMTRALGRIVEVAQQLRAAGSHLVLVPVPAKVDIYRNEGEARAGAAMQAQYAAFLAGLRRRGLDAVDTRPALRPGSAGGQTYLTSDTHWTPRGAAQAARAVAGSGLVETGDTRFRKVADRPEEFTGDLVSFVTSDRIAPELGLTRERVRPYVAEKADAAAGGIFAADDVAADAVLVGTSYSANPNWSFVPALKLALGRDILNLAQEGRGPFAPMRDYLGGAGAEGPAPALVLWEFPVRYLGTLEQPADRQQQEAANG